MLLLKENNDNPVLRMRRGTQKIYTVWKNKICKLFGIQYPIVQGGMVWISGARLAAAVSEAGGLGAYRFGVDAGRRAAGTHP